MKMKKFLAVAMAATMVVGSGVTALATSGTTDVTTSSGTKTITGSGTEAFVNKNVVKVTVPTTLTNLFDYKLDPQGLVTETKNYDGTTVTAETGAKAPQGLVFKNDGNKVSNESDPVTVTNKSSVPVKMGITVTLTRDGSGLDPATQFADTNEFDTDKPIYLGLKTTNDFEKALNKASVSSANILLSGASQYEAKYTSGTGYAWAEKDNAEFSDFTFSLTGAIDTNVAYDTWATVDGNGNVTMKNPPAVSVKFDLTAIKDALPAGVMFYPGDDLLVYSVNGIAADLTDGGLGTTAPTKVEINGKTLDGTATIGNGYVVVSFADIVKTFGGDSSKVTTDAAKKEYKDKVKSAFVTVGGVDYYGEIAGE